jgi:hypothetical protein
VFLDTANRGDSDSSDKVVLGSDQVGDGSIETGDNNTDANSDASDGSREEKKRGDKRVQELNYCVNLSLEGGSHSRSQVCDSNGDGSADVLKSVDGAANSGSELDELLRSKANCLAGNSSYSSGGYTDDGDCRCVQGLTNGLVVGLDEGLDLDDYFGIYVVLDSIDGIVCGIVSIQELVADLQEVLTDLVERYRHSIRESVD